VSERRANVMAEVMPVDATHDSRAVEVLERSLGSTSRATRLRAVAMLAQVACPSRVRWLEGATHDRDRAVRDTALAVLAWVTDLDPRECPDREDPRFDTPARTFSAEWSLAEEQESAAGAGWEYAVEVWRADGLPIGVFAAFTCAEDDAHARSIALGQAIMACTSREADPFDPATAAAFIVSKERRPRARPRHDG
jgi:hypothetical protein